MLYMNFQDQLPEHFKRRLLRKIYDHAGTMYGYISAFHWWRSCISTSQILIAHYSVAVDDDIDTVVNWDVG